MKARTETEVIAVAAAGGKQRKAPQRASLSARKRKEAAYGLALIAPAVILVIGIIVVPVTYLITTSFTNAHAYLPNRDFVGFQNYIQLFSSNSQFWTSLGITTLYAALTLVLQLVVGTVVAQILHQSFKGRAIIRLIALIPYMIPAVPVAILWRWLFDPKYGAWADWINRITGTTANLLGPELLFASLVFVSVWMFAPFVTISVLARLQTLDPSVNEAARLDGAGALRAFFSVTLPQILPVILMLALLRFMFMFTKFDIIYLFAGTGQNVRTLPVLTFQTIFGESRLGLGSATAVIMCLILIVFVTAYLKILGRKSDS